MTHWGRRRPSPPLTKEQQGWIKGSIVVRKLAGYFVRKRVLAFDDLVSIGNEAIVRAAAHFDPMRGTAFDGFAYSIVHMDMDKAVRQAVRKSRGPRAGRAVDAGYVQLDGERTGGNVFDDSDRDNADRLDGFCDGIAGAMFAGLAGGPVEQRDVEAALVEAIARARDVRALGESLADLPEQPRRLLVLRYVEEREWDDVAQGMGVSVATARRDHNDATKLLGARLRRAGVRPAHAPGGE